MSSARVFVPNEGKFAGRRRVLVSLTAQDREKVARGEQVLIDEFGPEDHGGVLDIEISGLGG